MNLTTKANIGDTIYFMYDNKICSDIIKSISTDTRLKNSAISTAIETEVAYHVRNKSGLDNFSIVYDHECEVSYLDLIKRLTKDYDKTGAFYEK